MPEALQSVLSLLNENDVQEVIDYLASINDNCEVVAFLKDHFEIYEGD